MPNGLFERFEAHRLTTRAARIHALVGGAGPPLLLLHGYPQNHVMWHAVAPQLRDRFSLVLPDLRGYGDSAGPAPDPEHVGYSKRVMAQDMISLMSVLGFETFFLAGHDRGARVAYRLALDHPDRVMRLAVLDILPTLDVWAQIDQHTAMASYHWLLLSQPAPLPERLIGCDPEFFIQYLLERWAGRRNVLDPRAVAEYVRHFREPSVIAAACEDYRASATVDLELDRQDRAAGRRIRCPVLLVWSKRFLGASSAPPAIWKPWADDLTDVALDCGHFVAEEEPAACAAALTDFFRARAP